MRPSMAEDSKRDRLRETLRPTSAAKTISPDDLSRSRSLKDHFNRVQSGPGIEQRSAEQAPERTTSAAKEISPDALSTSKSLKEHFDRVQSGQQTVAQGARGSQQKAPRQEPQKLRDLKPGGRLQDAVDRPLAAQQRASVSSFHAGLNQAAKARHQQEKLLQEKSNERDKDNDDRSR